MYGIHHPYANNDENVYAFSFAIVWGPHSFSAGSSSGSIRYGYQNVNRCAYNHVYICYILNIMYYSIYIYIYEVFFVHIIQDSLVYNVVYLKIQVILRRVQG